MLKEAYNEKYYYSEKTTVTEPVFLSLFISSGSFIYSISTQQYKNIVELGHVELTNAIFSKEQFNEELIFLTQHYGLNQKKFEKTLITFLNNDFDLVPEAYGSDTDSKAYLQFSTGLAEVKKMRLHHLKQLRFSYGADPDLLNYLEKTFVNASIRHGGAVSIDLFFNQHSLSGSNLFLNLHDGALELCARNKDALLFYNVFNYSLNEDILYYLLFGMEQLAINPLEAKLAIACERPVTDELVKSLKKYIRHVSFCVTDPSVVLKNELAALPQHYYFTVLNQHTCAL